MRSASVCEIARSMILLWGRSAAKLAGEYVRAFERQGRLREAEKWNSVQSVVIEHLNAVR
jgi:hypothetical protein